jgi:hypothetical protein
MPRHLDGLPFPPLLQFNENRDFTIGDLTQFANQRPQGVSISVRYSQGPANRGGYFFHFRQTSPEATEFQLYDFEHRPLKVLSPQSIVAFINHCTGRRFDEPSFILCQNELNFQQDAQPSV